MEYLNKKVDYIDEKSKNLIWLCGDDNIITLNNIIVTNRDLYLSLIEELIDINNYIYTESHFNSEYISNDSFIKYVGKCTKAIKCEKDENTSHGHTATTFRNPRNEVLKLMTDQFNSSMNLLDFFGTYAYGENNAKKLKDLERARYIIFNLMNSSLDIECLSEIIKQISPNFGYYATQCLGCTDFEKKESYDINQLNQIIASSKKAGVEVSNQVRDILSHEELAKNNGKVLSLAKKAYNLTHPL